MLCTIITPTYKRLKFIKKQYKNLKVNLKKFNCEWLVAAENDDLPTIKYLQSIKNKNVTLVVGKFGGSAKAFSKCYKNSKGKYLNFSGDDDFRTVNFFKGIKTSDGQDVIIGQGIFIKDDFSKTRLLVSYLKSLFLKYTSYNTLRSINHLMSPSVIYKKKIAIKEKGLDYKNYWWTNDYEFNLRLLKNYSFVVHDKIFTKCTYSQKTISGKYNFKKFVELWKLNNKNNSYTFYYIINSLFLFLVFLNNLLKVKK